MEGPASCVVLAGVGGGPPPVLCVGAGLVCAHAWGCRLCGAVRSAVCVSREIGAAEKAGIA